MEGVPEPDNDRRPRRTPAGKMSRRKAVVQSIDNSRLKSGIQKLTTEYGPAINYIDLADQVELGDTVLINRTANDLNLGTGGNDFVIVRLDPPPKDVQPDRFEDHLMRLRYTPFQHVSFSGDLYAYSIGKAGETRKLDLMPVVVGELHSQIAPLASVICLAGLRYKFSYVMTDSASLSVELSDLLYDLRESWLVDHTYCIGQSFGMKFDVATTLHSAITAVKYGEKHEMAIVTPGPGQTGTGTKYGFSGIEQASNLDIVAALGGTPIACVRASSADKRERHQGISHHTKTVLELVRSRCIVAMPEGLDAPDEWLEKHDVRTVSRDHTQPALDLLKEKGINVTTMGRGIDEDPLFFHAAAAAGTIAAKIALQNRANENG